MSNLEARECHCAGALVLSSRLTEVIIFGGRDRDYGHLAATTVLRFGKYTFSFIVMCYYFPLLVCLAQMSDVSDSEASKEASDYIFLK